MTHCLCCSLAAVRNNEGGWLTHVNLLKHFRIQWNLCACRPRAPLRKPPLGAAAPPASHRRLRAVPAVCHDRVARTTDPLKMIFGFAIFWLSSSSVTTRSYFTTLRSFSMLPSKMLFIGSPRGLSPAAFL